MLLQKFHEKGQGPSVLALMQEINQFKESMTTIHAKISQMEALMSKMDSNIGRNEKEIEAIKSRNHLIGVTGTSYIRWGRTSCPGNGSELIYSGYAGGSYYSHEGGAVSLLCLPSQPDWANYDDTVQDSTGAGYVYGAEYLDNNRDEILFKKKNYLHDVPCAVCEVSKRSDSIMIAAKISCYPGWTMEYRGYLMSGHYEHKAARDYHCVDANPENVSGGYNAHYGYLLYFVEGRCGSLKCPPYREGRELACVVCTK